MGEVYLARDTQLGRDVAIKVLPSTYSVDQDRLHRFEQEACAASALNHPNILIVHDIGAHDGAPYVVSELLEGETLRKRTGGTPLAQRRAIEYALQIAQGSINHVSKLLIDGHTSYPMVATSNLGFARAAFSVSENGVLVYRSGSSEINQPLWFDRGGKQIGALGAAGLYLTLSLSPDESRVALDRVDIQTGTYDIWLVDLLRNIPSRFTAHPSDDSHPVWSPDGSRIVFTSGREGQGNLYQKSASGSGNEEVLLKSSIEEAKVPDDWSSDGRFILYQNVVLRTKQDLWVLPMSGDRQPFPLLQTEFNEHQAQFSPDGKWIVYTSDERRKSTSRHFRFLVLDLEASCESRPAAEARGDGGAMAKSFSTLPPIGNSWQLM